ncbi:MAG: BamA/TamA family outer membrane protein, partial [Pseudomonadota bacterium]
MCGRLSIWGFLSALSFAGPAAAQDVSITVTDSNDQLKAAIARDALSVSVAADAEARAQDLVAAARADYRRLLTTLYAQGYYGGSISITLNGREASSLAPLFAPASIGEVVISVDPGAAFTFGSVTITPVADSALVVDDLKPGARAGSDVIRNEVSQQLEAWRDRGHAKATVAQQSIVANHRDSELNVNVEITPGPQLTFGDLTISGDSDVRESAIRRIAGLPTGETYSPAALTDAARRLRKTGAFSGIALIEFDDIGPNDTLPITAQIQDAKPRRFGFGIELSSVSGLKVSSFWMHRNAFGGAENFRIEGEIGSLAGETGGTDYSVGASLGIPAIYGPDTDLRMSFGIAREDEPDFLLDRASFDIIASRIVTENLTLDIGVGIQRAREETSAGIDRYTLLTLPFALDFDKRDDEKDTKSGYQIIAELTPFTGLQGGADGGIIYSDAKAFRSFGEDKQFTLAARGQVGSILGASLADTPADFLFYSGGSGTVRGHEYQALGITGPAGDTGGTSFLGAQLEARYDVTRNIGIVGFYDYGYIGSSSIPGEDGDWHSGTGLGVR